MRRLIFWGLDESKYFLFKMKKSFFILKKGKEEFKIRLNALKYSVAIDCSRGATC